MNTTIRTGVWGSIVTWRLFVVPNDPQLGGEVHADKPCGTSKYTEEWAALFQQDQLLKGLRLKILKSSRT
jgi:hypothetical protein